MNYHRELVVWLKTVDGPQRVGEIVWESLNGKTRSAFRYSAPYLESRRSFAFDPVHLPLGPGHYSIQGAPENGGLFSVFIDSLPDDWGRRILIKHHKLTRTEQDLPNLLLKLGGAGLGVLAYTAPGQDMAWPYTDFASMLQLPELQQAAELFEKGEETDAEVAMLLGAGSSPGGARPKALVYDADADRHYIAKFPSVKDHVDVVRIECATMALAGKAGLEVPPTRLAMCGGKPVLLVDRFDINRMHAGAGRRHMISMQTLLNASGYYVLRYSDVFKAIKAVSAAPAEDGERFFRQMVFNAVVDNTDDHLKNFWMIYDGVRGWRLSPAFDLVPDIGRKGGEHTLMFEDSFYCPTRDKLVSMGKDWKVRSHERIVDEVFTAVGQWREEYASHGVPEADIDRFRSIDSNLG